MADQTTPGPCPDEIKDAAISFVLWLADYAPDTLYKHAEDEDGGEAAFRSFYDIWKARN